MAPQQHVAYPQPMPARVVGPAVAPHPDMSAPYYHAGGLPQPAYDVDAKQAQNFWIAYAVGWLCCCAQGCIPFATCVTCLVWIAVPCWYLQLPQNREALP